MISSYALVWSMHITTKDFCIYAKVFKKEKRKKDDNVHFIEDVIEFAKELVQSPGKDIWLVGGAEIISIFLNTEMINEIILSMHPIVLGRGIPLFKNLQRQLNLKLVKSIPYQNGLMQLYYKPGYQISKISYCILSYVLSNYS